MKKLFTHLMAFAAAFACSLNASAQFSATVEEIPVGYQATPVTFSLTDVAAAVGTDATTLGSALDTWIKAEGEVETNYFFLANPDDADNPFAEYTQGGRGGFWMTKDSKPIGWSGDGSNGDAWYNIFGVDLEESVLVLEIGQHPDAFTAGEEVSAQFILVYEGKKATFDITLKVVEDDTPVIELPEAVTFISKLNIVGSQVIEVAQEPRTNYASDAVEADLTGVAALLGTTDDVIAGALADMLYTTTFTTVDEIPMKTDSLTKEASAGAPGWWFAQVWDTELQTLGSEVVRKGYGNDCSFYIETFNYNTETFKLSGNLGQYPSNLVADDVRTANVYLIYGDKAYQITYNLTITAKSTLSLDEMEKVGSEDVEVSFEVADTYDGGNISIDLAAVLEALGVESIKDVTVMVMDDGGLSVSNTANNGGSWLNAEGLITSWGSGSTMYFEPEIITVEDVEQADWSNVYVGQYPNALEADTDYPFSFYFVNGEKYYAINVTIHALASSVIPIDPDEEVAQSEYHSVAEKTVNIQVIPDGGVYEIPTHYFYDAQEVSELLGTTAPVLFTLAAPNDDPEAKYTKAWNCTPYPGFWMNKDGYIGQWNDGSSPWGATFSINEAEVTLYQMPGFSQAGAVYSAPMFLVNTLTGAMVTFNFTLRFVSEIVEIETVGEETLLLPVANQQMPTVVDVTKAVEALGAESANELVLDRQALVFMLADGTFSTGSDPGEGVMLTAKGVFDQSEGSVESKVYFWMEEAESEGSIIFGTEGLGFAEGDRVDAKIGLQFNDKRYVYDIIFLDPAAYSNVRGIQMDGKDATLYDLSGRRVADAAQHGIYIQAGRKIVKK